MNSVTDYFCGAGCCHVHVIHGGPHGKDWKVTVNGASVTVKALAMKLGIETSTIRKRMVNHTCLSMPALPRGTRGQKAQASSSQALGMKFATLRWIQP